MLTLVTPAALWPVTVAEAKANSRITTSAEDTLVQSLIAAATLEAEHLMQRALLPQQWKLTADTFSIGWGSDWAGMVPATQWRRSDADVITLRRPPVTAVDSVKYYEPVAGVLTTLAVNTDYLVLELGADTGTRLVPAVGKSWPATQVRPSAVEITFTTGYADAASVPELIKAWIKQRVGALYEHRESWSLGKPILANEAADRLLDRYRLITL